MNKTEKLQFLWKHYEEEHGHQPIGTRPVVDWAVSKGLLDLPTVDPYDVLASQMAQALRAETAVDGHGRIYRVNHAVKIMRNGVQTTLWAMLGYASREHMEITFTQRREQIVGDCLQLRTDVDAYNELNPAKPPIQLELDFSEDVAERLIMKAA